jgi:hypothetical protein
MFFGGPVVTNARAFYTTRAAAGALSAPHFLRPLRSGAELLCKTRAKRVARMRRRVAILRDGARAPPQDEALMVRSAAKPRVSNHGDKEMRS